MLPSADDAAEDLAYNVGHGSVARFVAMMNAQARHARADAHALLDADRARHAGQLLDRRRPRQARQLRPGRTRRYFARIVALPHAVLHPATTPRYVVNRNDLVGGTSVDRRRQDRPHRRRRLRAGRLRAQGRDDADQRRARDHQRGVARRQHAGAAGLRVRELPARARRSSRDRCSRPRRCATSPDKHARAGRSARRSADVVARSARVRIRVEAPRQLSGPMPQGSAARQRDRARRRAAVGDACRWCWRRRCRPSAR